MKNTGLCTTFERKIKVTEYLGRSQIWGLYNMLPFGLFEIEIIDNSYEEEKVLDSLSIVRNADNPDSDAGRKQLFNLLGRYQDFFVRVEAEFVFGFGFDLKVKAYV